MTLSARPRVQSTRIRDALAAVLALPKEVFARSSGNTDNDAASCVSAPSQHREALSGRAVASPCLTQHGSPCALRALGQALGPTTCH